MNPLQTKIKIITDEEENLNINIDGVRVAHVENFEYLGVTIEEREINYRIENVLYLKFIIV